MTEIDPKSRESCAVALPRERNRATERVSSATDSATSAQLTSLKALANKVLARNQARNQSATEPEKTRNFSTQKECQKLRMVAAMDEADSVGRARVFEYRLTDGPRWLVMLAPGYDLSEAERSLRDRFGERFVSVRELRAKS